MVYVRLARKWVDGTGASHCAGDMVDVDAATLAQLEQSGVVTPVDENATDENGTDGGGAAGGGAAGPGTEPGADGFGGPGREPEADGPRRAWAGPG
jgi:hypothetical protein